MRMLQCDFYFKYRTCRAVSGLKIINLVVVLDFDCKIVILQCVGMALTTCSATVLGTRDCVESISSLHYLEFHFLTKLSSKRLEDM